MDKVKRISIPTIKDHRGNLCFVENKQEIPFSIKRIFYVYDIPSGSIKGSHAHRSLEQFIIVMSGSFDIVLDDGVKIKTFHLNEPSVGLYIPPMVWSSQENFSAGCCYVVLTSDKYSESDYIRNYEQFINEKNI